MNLNIPEILVANGTAIIILAFLLLFRIRQKQFGQMHEQMFSMMLATAVVAAAEETLSFLIDGWIFPGCFGIQYLSNILCLGLTAAMGFFWSLFVDYRIYCSMKRLKHKAAVSCVPLLLYVTILISDVFGGGIIFTVNAENCYARGRLGVLTYLVLFIYMADSIVNVHNAKKKGIVPFFFPVYCFVVPCIIGTIVQGCFYGITTGWLSVSVAAVFVYLEMQTVNSYMDVTSGLFNRQYMNDQLERAIHSGNKFYGIMLDVDDFKAINDFYGHTVGDRAIYMVGKILSKSMFRNASAMRMGGDEFVVLLMNSSEDECKMQMKTIQKNVERFNQNRSEAFVLSVSMGSAYFHGQSEEEFLAQMDESMYEAKRKYHCSKQEKKNILQKKG